MNKTAVKSASFIKLTHSIYDTVFEGRDPIEITILLLLMRKYNGHNNGAISLGVREVEKRCRCGRATASRTLKRLRDDGLIDLAYKGHLVPSRPGAASRWRLNFLCDVPPENHHTRCSVREPSGWFSNGTSGNRA
jgi:hypothetical protein